MALWTPYAQEAALDLSKPAVKVETVSPLPASCAPQSPLLSKPYPSSYSESLYNAPYPCRTAAYPYQQASYPGQSASYPHQPVTYPAVPSATSPDSIASWSHIKPPASSPSESAEIYDSLSDDAEFQAFERDAMQAMAERNGGSLLGNNPRMRRAVQTSRADESYRKQRERNNIAAKESRDRRKLREMRLALQVTFLKKKMAELRGKLSAGVCGRCRQIYEC